MYLDKIIKETFLNKYFSKIAFNNLKEISRYINKLTSYKNQAIFNVNNLDDIILTMAFRGSLALHLGKALRGAMVS